MDTNKIAALYRELLVELGEDPDREGLKETPARVAAWWREFIDYNPGNYDTTFESITTDQMVAVSGIRVWSLCEHHLLPFWCDVSIGYVTGDKVIGLSKLARIAHLCAHKLQLQERLTNDIADAVADITGTQSVAVIGTGVHLCMVARGIKTHGVFSTSVMRGVFREKPEARHEFMAIAFNHHET